LEALARSSAAAKVALAVEGDIPSSESLPNADRNTTVPAGSVVVVVVVDEVDEVVPPGRVVVEPGSGSVLHDDKYPTRKTNDKKTIGLFMTASA
jgi:hypothetical protein